jgi:hypothetical protein
VGAKPTTPTISALEHTECAAKRDFVANAYLEGDIVLNDCHKFPLFLPELVEQRFDPRSRWARLCERAGTCNAGCLCPAGIPFILRLKQRLNAVFPLLCHFVGLLFWPIMKIV